MQQPYPLTQGGKLDFSFDATELLELGDDIASYTLTASQITVSEARSSQGYVTFFANWDSSTVPIGTSGVVVCTIISNDGRILEKTMDFFAVSELS